MHSNGGVMTPEVAQARPVAMMESGPVGGIIASAEIGEKLGYGNVISFDMGGTTAKASLIRDGEPTMAPGYYVGGYASGHPVMVPMIDVVEIGAGGGSIAWRDEIGALKVGPQSAGAEPGPICYRGGGTEPTITDANVVLGRLDPNNFLGGTMKLDADGARARHRGGHRQAARHERERRPRRRSSISPSTRCRSRCAKCRWRRATIRAISSCSRPAAPVRCTCSPSRANCTSRRSSCRCFRRTSRRWACCSPTSATISSALIIPISPASTSASSSGCTTRWWSKRRAGLRHTKGAEQQVHLDLRYTGQEFTLPVPVTMAQLKKGDRRGIRTAFDELYEQRYAHHSPDEPVEMVNIRLAVIGKRPKLKFPKKRGGKPPQPRRRPVYLGHAGKPVSCPVYARDTLAGRHARSPGRH